MTRSNRKTMYCSVFGCVNNSTSNSKLSFFRTPTEEERRTKWLRLINREDLLSSQVSTTICEAHFKADDLIAWKNRKILKKNCFPCMQLPNAAFTRNEKETQIDITTVDTSSQTMSEWMEKLTEITASLSADTLNETEETMAKDMFHKLCERFLSKSFTELVKSQTYLKSTNKGSPTSTKDASAQPSTSGQCYMTDVPIKLDTEDDISNNCYLHNTTDDLPHARQSSQQAVAVPTIGGMPMMQQGMLQPQTVLFDQTFRKVTEPISSNGYVAPPLHVQKAIKLCAKSTQTQKWKKILTAKKRRTLEQNRERQRRYREQNREKLRQLQVERRKRKKNIQIVAEPSTYSNINRIELNNEEITDTESQSLSSGLEGQTSCVQVNHQYKSNNLRAEDNKALQKRKQRQLRYRERNREKLRQREAVRRQRQLNSEDIAESSISSNIDCI